MDIRSLKLVLVFAVFKCAVIKAAQLTPNGNVTLLCGMQQQLICTSSFGVTWSKGSTALIACNAAGACAGPPVNHYTFSHNGSSFIMTFNPIKWVDNGETFSCADSVATESSLMKLIVNFDTNDSSTSETETGSSVISKLTTSCLKPAASVRYQYFAVDSKKYIAPLEANSSTSNSGCSADCSGERQIRFATLETFQTGKKEKLRTEVIYEGITNFIYSKDSFILVEVETTTRTTTITTPTPPGPIPFPCWIVVALFIIIVVQIFITIIISKCACCKDDRLNIIEGKTLTLTCPSPSQTEPVVWMGPPNLNPYSKGLSINSGLLQELRHRLLVTGDNDNGYYDLQVRNIGKAESGDYMCKIGSIVIRSVNVRVITQGLLLLMKFVNYANYFTLVLSAVMVGLIYGNYTEKPEDWCATLAWITLILSVIIAVSKFMLYALRGLDDQLHELGMFLRSLHTCGEPKGDAEPLVLFGILGVICLRKGKRKPGPVRNLRGTPKSQEITVEWIRPKDPGDNPETLRYRVSWQEDGNNKPPGKPINTQDTNCTLDILTCGMKYVVTVYAINCVGESCPTTIYITTKAGKPGPVRNLEGTPKSKEIKVKWIRPKDPGDKPETLHYRVSWQEDGNNKPPGKPINTQDTNCTLDILTCGMKYVVTVYAINCVGESCPTTIYITTKADSGEHSHGQGTGHSNTGEDKRVGASKQKDTGNASKQPRDSGAVSRTDIELTEGNFGQDRPLLRPQPPLPDIGKSHQPVEEPHHKKTRGLSGNFDDPNSLPQLEVLKKKGLDPISAADQGDSNSQQRQEKRKKTKRRDTATSGED